METPGTWGETPGTWRGTTSSIYVDAPAGLESGREREKIILTAAACPECGGLVLTVEARLDGPEGMGLGPESVIWPLQSTRPVPEEVPEPIAADYREAALVLNLSPKASAALSRRCLQAVLREAGKAEQQNLSEQIDAVIPQLPAYLARDIDHIRHIGNFAAHPTKAKSSGEIVDVEVGEATWNLDVLDMLFDHYYVKPALAGQRREALDAKLREAGKPPMKGKDQDS